jgi:hypothetical protein
MIENIVFLGPVCINERKSNKNYWLQIWAEKNSVDWKQIIMQGSEINYTYIVWKNNKII